MPPLIHNFFRYQKISGKQKGSFTKLFVSVLWDKKFRQNRDAPPSYAWNFSIKEFFWNTKVFSNEIFWYSEKNFDGKSGYPPSYPNSFDTRNYCNRKVRKISALWDENFSTENLETPPPPLLSINFFATGNFLKHSTEGFSYQIFRQCETKKFSTENCDTSSPLFDAQNFSLPEFFWCTEVFPNEIFRYCETKKFERKVVHRI